MSNANRKSQRSGIDAAAEVALPSESFHELGLLQTDYIQRFNPRFPEERALVDILASSEWLLRRFRRIEGELLTRSCQDVTPSQERFCLADAFDQNARSLERLQRRVNATTKTYMKTLELLTRLQNARQPRPVRREQVASPEAVGPAIGFVPPLPEFPPLSVRSIPVPPPFLPPAPGHPVEFRRQKW